MRDAELFSLTMGCVQHAKYSQCHRAPNCSVAWGAHYDTNGELHHKNNRSEILKLRHTSPPGGGAKVRRRK